MSLRAIGKSIIFKFDNSAGKSLFNNTTESGIVFSTALDTLSECRWGTVTSVGSLCNDVVVGDSILIENLQWTEGVEHEGEKFWQTTEDYVMAVRVK